MLPIGINNLVRIAKKIASSTEDIPLILLASRTFENTYVVELLFGLQKNATKTLEPSVSEIFPSGSLGMTSQSNPTGTMFAHDTCVFLVKNYCLREFKKAFTIDNTMEARSAVPNPSIVKPGTIRLVIINTIALITKVNNPSVSIFIGNVRITKKGLNTTVSIPHTTEITKSEIHPLISIPGKIYAVI
jgi:hypothetical protein